MTEFQRRDAHGRADHRRAHQPNRNTLHYEATITDPGAYAEPWTIAWDVPWLEGAKLAEYICRENNMFLLEIKDDHGNPFVEDVPTQTPEPNDSGLRRRTEPGARFCGSAGERSGINVFRNVVCSGRRQC